MKPTSVLARTDDGTLQLTLTIPGNLVQTKKEEALKVLSEKVEIPGFRRGKAPKEIAQKRIDKQDLYNEMLSRLLPEVYADSVEEHKLKPILAPRFEILSVSDENDNSWVVRAVTCELPNVEVGDYRNSVKGVLPASNIVIPGKEENKKTTPEEKEQKVLEVIIKNSKAQIPTILVEEEVNHKLARLVDQTQKLGLTVEQYLASTGKTLETLKAELAQQAREGISLELALNKIAEEEKVIVEESEVEQIVRASSPLDPRTAVQQKAMIAGVLKRRKALDKLMTSFNV